MIHFPNVLMMSPQIDFHGVLNDSVERRNIQIQNVTPLHVSYKFVWRKCIVSVPKELTSVSTAEIVEDTEINEPTNGDPLTITPNLLSTAEPDLVKPNENPKKLNPKVTPEENVAVDIKLPSVKKSSEENFKTRVLKTIAPMIDKDYGSQLKWCRKFPKITKINKVNLNDILSVTPHRGHLNKNETQFISVTFTPKQDVIVDAVLECQVLGGPAESIIITGRSSPFNYHLSSEKVNFKIRSFTTNATKVLRITNTNKLSFQYRTYLNQPKPKSNLEGTIIKIDPPEKTVDNEEFCEIQIVVKPGVLGYFNRTFLLQVGHCPHVPIEVFGWGGIPQVYLASQKHDLSLFPEELGYLAISKLTTEYLDAVNEIFAKCSSKSQQHLTTPLTETCLDDPTLKKDWHICSSWDIYPSMMDIELAIERYLVTEHLELHPEILTQSLSGPKAKHIPGFRSMSCEVDFGVVMTGSTAQQSIEIINYGPVATKVNFPKGTKFPPWLDFKLCGTLLPGETKRIEATLKPTSDFFPESEQHIETDLSLEVPYGVTIPLKIRALCAVPYLVTTVAIMNFGLVKCGNKVVCSIPLKNIGKPTCVWYATLKMKVHSSAQCMFLLDSSGSYAPDEGGWLKVSFRPTMDMVYEGTLIFRFHMNPKRMTIPVKGVGLSPRVQIIGPEIIFPPTLPWSKPVSIYFGITNPCPFPIELVFVHCDKQFDEEQHIFEVLSKYYDYREEMLVPMMPPGDPLPPTIRDFQRNIIEHAKKCLALDAKALKRLKSPKGQPTAAKKIRTQEEVAEDALQAMKNANVDPLAESLIAAEPVIPPEIPKRRGMLIFFHGAPGQEEPCEEIAYAVGNSLGIPAINIDNTIVEALCASQSEAKTSVIASINDMYENISKHLGDDTDENLEEEYNDPDDEYSTLRRKISFIYKKGHGSKKLANVTKKSVTAVSTTSLGLARPSLIFHMELIQELLEEIFSEPRFDRGFVLATLTSQFVTKPQVLLSTILKCKCSIKNIHLVLCHSDINKWVQAFEEAQRVESIKNQPKVYEESEIQDIIRQFDEMTPEEYDLASPELKSVFLEHGLEERRKKHLERSTHIGPMRTATSDKLNEKSSLSQIGTSENLFKKSSMVIRRKSIAETRKSPSVQSMSESKRKLRREESKGKQSNEYVTMNTKFNEYNKQAYETLVTIANNWNVEECELAFPLCGFYGQVLGGKKPRLKTEQVVSMLGGSNSDKGFPLTIVLDKCLKYKRAIVNMFRYSEVAKEAFENDMPEDILRRAMERMEYTVLLPRTFPTMKQEESLQWRFLNEAVIKKCECIHQNLILDDSTEENIINILTKWHCTCGKKLVSAQTSTTEVHGTLEKHSPADKSPRSEPLPLAKVKSLSNLDTRLILEPGDLMRCKYTFSPKDEGYYNVKRFAEVNGWPASRVTINVFGVCDLPKIDSRPKKMFKDFVRRTREETTYRHTYLDDRKVFEFGPIFIGLNRTYEQKYRINLKNASLLTAETTIQFKDVTTIFEVAKKNVTLAMGSRDTVTISAAPVQVGEHTNVLLLSTKDNPDIIAVNVVCTGIVPRVFILPTSKSIEYGKLLLYRRQTDRFIVKNDSALPIKWVIRNVKDFEQNFIIDETSGVVDIKGNQVVHVIYVASEVGIIVNKALIIDIYDAEGRGNPMRVETLNLSAECYDVQVECGYENLNENYLNFENVKVNSTVARDVYLINRGKYSIFFKLEKVKDFPEPSLLKSFETSQVTGLLPPSLKIVPITFQCTPKTSMKLLNVPAYNCLLLDGGKEQVVVAKFPICVAIASFYNTFTLFPLRQLNFKIAPVGTLAARELFLENTSKCPFTYSIVLPSKYQHTIQDASASTPSMKGKDKLKTAAPLRCGNFLISNDDNLLAPGASKTIPVQFLATAPKIFEETITFVVSDTNPTEGKGVPLKLVGVGAMPSLDIWNIETTFREHHIVKSISEYKVPEVTPHCVFVEDTESLHFFSVIVQTKYIATIDLYNDGLVSCTINMTLKYQNNTNAEIFSLDKYETDIEPLVHKNLEIIFTPKALQEYRAVLEIHLKLYENKSHTYKICLIGEGNIPRIAILEPNVKHTRFGVLNLPATCVGSLSKQAVKFQNISSVISQVEFNLAQTPTSEQQSIFWLTADTSMDQIKYETDQRMNLLKIITKPDEILSIYVNFNPIKKGIENCILNINIEENPYEMFTVKCDAEAFMEDVVLLGLAVLGENEEAMTAGSSGTINSSKKKGKRGSRENKKKASISVTKHSASSGSETHSLKYLLDFGGCELNVLQRRSVIMFNNSDKVYKFMWNVTEYVVIKPSVGFISPTEEKDLEIMFISKQPINLKKETVNCTLSAISDDSLTNDVKGTTWDSRKCVTMFNINRETGLNERREEVLNEQGALETGLGVINIAIVYSAKTEYTSYNCSLLEELSFNDTFIYQKRTCEFTVENTSNVPMKLYWRFIIDEQYPARLDKMNEVNSKPPSDNVPSALSDGTSNKEQTDETESSNSTLFSENEERASVDTWFEVQLPFTITPTRECIPPRTTKTFTIIFAPLDAFDYKVRLKSVIANLDPIRDQNISCAILAKSLIPYCHLEVEESDYLTTGRRKVVGGVALPAQITVLEFNVLGSGCYKKTIKLINPTNEGYDFILERVLTEKSELVPVQSDKWKGFLEGGTTTTVTFTFVPTDPGVYETQWKFLIPVHSLALNLLVVGIVREPVLEFIPKILWIRNSLVGFTTTESVMLKNHETKTLRFEFKGNSLCDETGKTPVIVEPNEGVLKPRSEIPIKITYTPAIDGPLTFKIYCSVKHLTKPLTITVNALSYSIKPKVTYCIYANEHELNSQAITNIHLEETASNRERKIVFKIKNEGSKTFSFDWKHNCASVKKYLQVDVEPSSGYIAPGLEKDCTLHFNLRQVTVHAFPVTLSIGDGPVYNINLHATIKRPLYRFSCKEIDFGKCIINAPEKTYSKRLRFFNDDIKPVTLEFNFENLPELHLHRHSNTVNVSRGDHTNIVFYFQPKEPKEYEFKVSFFVNSLCEEILTIRGEGVPLLFDLYEGCHKSYDLGDVRVGEKVVREIEVMNHSQVPIKATLSFRDMSTVGQDIGTSSEATSLCFPAELDANPSLKLNTLPTNGIQTLKEYKSIKNKNDREKDLENALASLKVVPNTVTIKPHSRMPLKIRFKPVGLISDLRAQLNIKVFDDERPLVLLRGCATGMDLKFTQEALEFSNIRRRGRKVLKVVLMNNGDFGTRFWWEPIKSDEFTLSPLKGYIAPHTNVTFTVSCRPLRNSPFMKTYCSLKFENHKPLELVLNATCVETGSVQNISMHFDAPVRGTVTEYVAVTNPTDRQWLVCGEVSNPGVFETLSEFLIDPNSTFSIPIHYKPKFIGTEHCRVLFSPLGDQSLHLTLEGEARHPEPNGTIDIHVAAKQNHTEELKVYHTVPEPESYVVYSEVIKTTPEKFEAFFDLKHPETIKVWGDAFAICRWTFICFAECVMNIKVVFINEDTREYQYYYINVTVTPSGVVDAVTLVSYARETIQKEILVENKLQVDAEFEVFCESDAVLYPDRISVKKNSNKPLLLTYSPLVAGVTEEQLEVRNSLVESYFYKLILKCLPAKTKKLEISTPLGTRIPVRLRVRNHTDGKADFLSTVSHPSIIADKEYILYPSEKGKFLVWFEPTELGEQGCKVSFSSPVAGEFVFDITGTATSPKPQGPVPVKVGGSATIVFKNVFTEPRTFRVSVDRKEFFLKTLNEQIKPKKEMKLSVYLQTSAINFGEIPKGCLTIECVEPPEYGVQWIYFLQGVV